MKKAVLILIIVASALVVIGLVVVGASLVLGGKIGQPAYQPTNHRTDEAFERIEIDLSASDLVIKTSPSGECYAVCDEGQRLTYLFEVKNGVLTFKESDKRTLLDQIGIQFEERECILYLPEGVYDELKIQNDSGDIECHAAGLTFGTATISTSSGDIECQATGLTFGTATISTSSGDIECHTGVSFGDLTLSTASGEIDLASDVSGALSASSISGDIEITGNTPQTVSLSAVSGAIELKDVVATEKMQVKTSSGNISLLRCDAKDMVFDSTSGGIRGSLLSDKLFDVRSTSGNLDYPPSVKDAGTCTVTTSSGNVRLTVVG